MKALVYRGPRSLTYEDVPDPVPAAGEALVRVRAAGICGSDLHAYDGHDRRRLPGTVLGHEAVAEVHSGSRSGQRVVINPLIACGACAQCAKGRTHLCAARRQLGVHRAGVFATWASVPEANLLPVPDGLADAAAALAEPAAVAVHTVERARRAASDPLPDIHALVIGGGSIGLLCALMLRHERCRQVAVWDTSAKRRGTLRAAGIGCLEPGWQDAARSDRPYQLVIDAVGVPATRELAVSTASAGGAVAHVGLGEPEGGVDFKHLTREELSIVGVARSSTVDMTRALELLAAGRLGDLGWVETRPLAAGAQAFAEMCSGAVAAAKVVLQP